MNEISTREWSILSDDINLDILPLEQDLDIHSAKGEEKKANVFKYIQKHQTVIGICIVIILAFILSIVLIVLCSFHQVKLFSAQKPTVTKLPTQFIT